MDSIVAKPIAVIGMSCRLPGADNVHELWQLLLGSNDAITSLPQDRLDRSLYFDPRKGIRGKTYSCLGGMIMDRPIDHKLVPLAKTRWNDYDECHWILSEVAASAWNHANQSSASTLRTGVYVGHSGGSRQAGELIYATQADQTASLLEKIPYFQGLPHDIRQTVARELVSRMRTNKRQRRAGGLPNLDASAAADLVAMTLGVEGPKMVIDAACASSLTALAMACLGLQSGQIDNAVVSGASYNKCDSLVLFSQAHSCSATGTRPFDQEADGLISSEGYVSLVLKTLDRAVADGDKVWGVIRGLGMSTDGRGKSLWAPRREGQRLAVERAYQGEVRMDRVQFIEAHATSTQVGDATEIQALADCFGKVASQKKLPIGSIKSHIGHTLETAGLAGLLKMLLAMHHETIPPTVNFRTPSNSIAWSSIPFEVPTKPVRWEMPAGKSPRCGAVNAFGIGGLNVHVVVEQFDSGYHTTGYRAPAIDRLDIKRNGTPLSAASQRPDAIAIVGRGVIVPGADGWKAFESLVQSKQSSISSPRLDRWLENIGVEKNAQLPWHVPTNHGGYLKDYAYDWRKHRVPPKQVEHANPLQFMLLDAAGQAIEEATQNGKSLLHERTSVVVGTIFGGEFGHQLQMGLRLVELRNDLEQSLRTVKMPPAKMEALVDEFEERFLETNPALLDETGSFTSSTLASRITKQYNLQGGALAIDSAECSACSALMAAQSLLQNGSSDAVVCASGHRAMDLPAFETLFAKGKIPRPGEPGHFPGEGVVVFLLKRLADAKRDNDTIYGVIDSIEVVDNAKDLNPAADMGIAQCIGDLQGAHGMVSILEFLANNQKFETIVERASNSLRYQMKLSKGTADRPLFHSAPVSEVMSERPTNNPRSMPTTLPLSQSTLGTARSGRAIATVFPGQGSQHSKMLEPWVRESNAARDTLDHANTVLARIGSPPFAKLVELAMSGGGGSSWSTQATMLIADTVHWSAWSELGVQVDAVTGHSLGELAAMVAANVWNLEAALQFVYQRAKAVDTHSGVDGALLSIQANLETVFEVLRHTPRSIHLTHHNGPMQVVVGGNRSDLLQFQSVLKSKQLSSTMLPVPAAFHTPSMSTAAEHLVSFAAELRLLPPRIPFFSGVSNRYEADPDAIRRNLITQLITPVLYTNVVHRLRQDGATVFIEIGPGQVLTKLNTAIDSSLKCLAMGKAVDAQGFSKELRSSIETCGMNEVFDSRETIHTRTSQVIASAGSLPRDPFFVDATATRRRKMRERAEAASESMRIDKVEPEESTPTMKPSIVASSQVTQPAGTDSSASSALETFVRDFIVEQTGYPPDMIQLDWDLEADLGIDSIKLVQLMGELREMFDLSPELLTSSSVHTLRDILGLLEGAGGKRDWLETPDSKDTAHDPEPLPHNSIPKSLGANADGIGGNSYPIANTKPPEPASVSSFDRHVIETFMVDFVIEHTGYPREMVDLHADLEADLGLDSIKLAQLFGELRSHFGLEPKGVDPKQLSGARSLSDILDVFHVVGNDPVAKSANIRPSTSRLEIAEGGTNSADSDEKGSETAYDRGVRYRHAIRDQLIADCNDKCERGDSSLDAIAILDNDEWVADIADGAGVHLENMRGLLRRHGQVEPWKTRFQDVFESKKSETNNAIEGELLPWEDEVTKRYILRTVPSALKSSASSEPRFFGPAFIIGTNPVATTLQRKLQSLGVHSICVDPSESTDSLLAQFDEYWKKEGVPHLFIAAPFDSEASIVAGEPGNRNLRTHAILSTFWVCQRWLIRNTQERSLNDSSLVAITNMGGDFGFTKQVNAPESGAFAGLLKAILIESWVNGHRQLPIKVIDAAPTDTPASIVDAVLTELEVPSFDTEVSWSGGERRVVRAIPEAIVSRKAKPSGGVWVCTGGGRGITALVAKELAERYGIELHLLGRAPAPNVLPAHQDMGDDALRIFKGQVMAEARTSGRNSVKAWQDMEKQLEIDTNLRQMRSEGIKVVYHCCDVSDEESLARCLETIRRNHGPIRGCLHGAGVGQDSRFERKRIDKVRECVEAKVDGLIHLMRHTWNDPVEYFIGFGSISGRFGANGHTDYSLANEALAKHIDWYRHQRPEVGAVAFHWHAWGDVGMATKPETKLALEMIDMQFMPAAEGIRHLIREIEAGAPEREVLITDDRYYRMFYPSETLDAVSNDTSADAVNNEAVDKNRPQATPLLEKSECNDNGVCASVAWLDPARDVFLKEHQLGKRPLLPFVISLELLAEGFAQRMKSAIAGPRPGLEFRSFEVMRGLKLLDDELRKVTVECQMQNEKLANVRLISSFRNRQGIVMSESREYAKATIGTFAIEQAYAKNGFKSGAPKLNLSQMTRAQYPSEDQEFFVGPAFRVLKRLQIAEDRIVGEIVAPSLIELVGNHRSNEGWIVPSAVIDACLFATGTLAWNRVRPGVNLPVSIELLRLFAMPHAGESCTVESHFRKAADRYAWFDFCLWGADGRVLLEATNYKTAWLG